MSDPTRPGDAADLMASMMKKQLFVIISDCLVKPEELQTNLEAHLRYLIGLENAGVLFASGPLFDGDGTMRGEGLTAVRAASFEAAEEIAAKDPFVMAGQRRPTVKSWIVNEGRVTVSVDISDCSGSLA